MLGTPLVSYAKNVIGEVIAVGRCGTLIDWESEVENRAYVSRYAAENILNWRVERINGRNITTLVALREMRSKQEGEDSFVDEVDEQIRVLRLVEESDQGSMEARPTMKRMNCVVEIWQREEKKSRRDKQDWKLVETRLPLRLSLSESLCAGQK